MKTAIISDIHSNLEALETVLRDIEAQKVDRIFCLGDIVGYGPDPVECIDHVMETCPVALRGNHDQGALYDAEGFGFNAERAILWTREILESRTSKQLKFLAQMPRSYSEAEQLFVHGSARNPLNEYVFPDDIHNEKKMTRIFDLVDKY